MKAVTDQSAALRLALTRHRGDLHQILERYSASNARLFGSVARGEAGPGGDIDLLVDLLPSGGNPPLRVSGIAEELSVLLDARLDVVAPSLLRDDVSASALSDAVVL